MPINIHVWSPVWIHILLQISICSYTYPYMAINIHIWSPSVPRLLQARTFFACPHDSCKLRADTIFTCERCDLYHLFRDGRAYFRVFLGKSKCCYINGRHKQYICTLAGWDFPGIFPIFEPYRPRVELCI